MIAETARRDSSEPSCPQGSLRPDYLYEALVEHPAPDLVVVDFDETLWLRNSTEEFLNSVRPRFLAAVVLQLIGVLKPWRVFQRGTPNHYRDWFRILAVLAVAPWSLWAWRRKAATLGPRLVNRPLLEAIQRRPEPGLVVVSLGFREIISPLLAAIEPRLHLRESSSLRSGARLRIEGKAGALRRHYGDEKLRRALVITDSEDDRDLLDASAKPFLIRWPDAHSERAGLKPLMPFVYLERVKRPGDNYLRNVIVGHDLPVLLLAYAVVSPQPLIATVAILLFLLAFFTAYETGYHENDRLGLLLEHKPKVSDTFHTLGQNFSPTFAWSLAILMAGVASLVAVRSNSWIAELFGSAATDLLAVWAAFVFFMLLMRVLFRWMNVVQPQGRIIPMLGLQVGRVLGFAIIFQPTIVGSLFCVAYGLSKWLPYVIYRFGGKGRDVPNHLNCLLLLTLFAGAVAIGGNPEAFYTWQSGLIFAYASARGTKNLGKFSSSLMPLTYPAKAAEAGATPVADRSS